MQCNLNSGRIYKGSIAQVEVQLYPKCYDPSDVTDVVLNFYTTPDSTSIEFSGDSITIDGNMGTVVFQAVQVEALEDGQLKYVVSYTYDGESVTRDMETRWFISTPNEYTPIDYISSENVEEVVEKIMGDDFVKETALTQTLLNYVTSSALSITLGSYATKSDLNTGLGTKQNTLVSGTNIKTINNQSLLGSGNINIQGGSGSTYTAGAFIDINSNNVISVTGITVPTSNTAFTNDAGYATTGEVQTAVSGKQDTLVSGTNIKTVNNQSLLGSGNIDIQGGATYTAGANINISSNNVISVSGINDTFITQQLGYTPMAATNATGIWLGTLAEYNEIPVKSETVIYFIK